MQKLPTSPLTLTKNPQKSFMKITSKKLPSHKIFTFGYLVAELDQYELKTFFDGKNFSMIYVGYSLYKAKKKFKQMIETSELKPLIKI